jgi:hypothetical protein
VRRGIAAAIGIVGGLAVIAGVVVLLRPEPQLQPCVERGVVPGDRAGCDLFRTDHRFMGERLSEERAVSLAKHPLYLPDRLPPALEGQHSEFWAVDRQVGVRYRSRTDSGLVVTFSLWPAGRDPADFYRRAPGEWGAGAATTINGWLAWIVPAFTEATAPPSASLLNVSVVHVTIDRTEVTLFGRVPIEDLVDATESLRRIG